MTYRETSKQPMDIRVAATAFIWLSTTGILLIWMVGILLLVVLGHDDSVFADSISDVVGPSFLIPMIALIVAAIATNKIWKVPVPDPKLVSPDHARQLEERLANLETILTREASRPEKLPRDL